VKKLSFGNALFNVMSQDLGCKSKDIEDRRTKIDLPDPPQSKKTETRGILKGSIAIADIPSHDIPIVMEKKAKRKLRWADGKNVDCKLITASQALCKVKYIPLEIRQRSGPELGTQVDKVSMMSNQNPASNEMYDQMLDTSGSNRFNNYQKSVQNTNVASNRQHGEILDTSRICTRKDILDIIVRWMPQWLEEQKLQKDEPGVEGKGWQINAVPSVYSSFKDYCNVVYPLMLHELWSTVFKDYLDQQSSTPSMTAKRPTFIACITEQIRSHSQRQQQINLTSLISYEESKLEREGSLPNRGWLVILELTFIKTDVITGERKGQQKKKFGFVERFRCYRRSKEHGNIYINQLEGTRMKYGAPREKLEYVMDLTISLKYLDPNLEGLLEVTKMVVIHPVSRIETSLRLFQAVEDAHMSPLFQNILRPKEKNFYLGMDMDIIPGIQQTIPQYKNLNNEQKRVVAATARMCTSNRGMPQMALIHGPPGTGKSTTMVALILQIFARCADEPELPRILVTAPSNTAVDELLRKLKVIRRQINHSHDQKGRAFSKFRMVRIGEEKKIHPDVKEYRLEILRDNEVNKRLKDKGIGDTLQEEIQRRQNAINSLGKQLAEQSTDPHQSRILHKRIRDEELALGLAKRNQGDTQTQREKERFRREVTDSILTSADIVATTLNR
jgi:hypothetical protein